MFLYLCGAFSAAAALVPNEIEITAKSQPVHSVCPIYAEVFGRTLIVSPQAQGREIHLGPLSASPAEMKLILPALLSAAGYSIRPVGDSLDLLEDSGPLLSLGQEIVSERITLRFASAADLVTSFPALFAASASPVVPTAAPVVPSINAFPSQGAGVIQQAPPQQSNFVNRAAPSVFAAPDNSLHFTGSRAQLVVAKAFVSTMDSPARLVSIRAVIGHVQLGGTYSTGLDFLSLLDDTSAGNNGSRSLLVPVKSKAASLSLYGQLGSLSRYIRLVDEDSEFRTDSRPSLFVRSGATAEISSGARVAYPNSVLTTSNSQASTSATVAYQDVVMRLTIEALVNSQDQITLKIKQTNDTITGSATISGNQVPNIGSQSLTTEVLLDSGSTVALGGIVSSSNQRKERGVSRLRKVPFIGRFFEVRNRDTSQEELIILIEATIK